MLSTRSITVIVLSLRKNIAMIMPPTEGLEIPCKTVVVHFAGLQGRVIFTHYA